MDNLPTRQPHGRPLRPLAPTTHVWISITPKSWFGRLVAAIVGAVLLLGGLLFSLLVVVAVVAVSLVALIAYAWSAKRPRHRRAGGSTSGET